MNQNSSVIDEDLLLDLATGISTARQYDLGFMPTNVSEDSLLKTISLGERFQFFCWTPTLLSDLAKIKNLISFVDRGSVPEKDAAPKMMVMADLISFGCDRLNELIKNTDTQNHLRSLRSVATGQTQFLKSFLNAGSDQEIGFTHDPRIERHVIQSSGAFLGGLLNSGPDSEGMTAVSMATDTIAELQKQKAGLFSKQSFDWNEYEVIWAFEIDLHDPAESNALVTIKSTLSRWRLGEIRLGSLCLMLRREASRLDFLSSEQWDEVQAILSNLWVTAFGQKQSELSKDKLGHEIEKSVNDDVSRYAKICLRDEI